MISHINMKKERDGGFTLLELLIVVSIIAILSVALVLVLNPAEALKKTRDSNRISDLSTMKTALGLYLTSTTTPQLGADAAGALNNNRCKPTPTTAWASPYKIGYSLPSATLITDTTLDGSSVAVFAQAADPGLTNGSGWIPVMFDNLIGGSPISNIPIDPINIITNLAAASSTDLVYRYACSVTPLTFELNAQLESEAFTTGGDNKRATDGGNNSFLYEVGTNLRILGTGADF